MSLEKTVRAEGGLRITRSHRPTKDELIRLFDSPRDEILAGIGRLLLAPENPSRKVYSVLREIYLARWDEFNTTVTTGFDSGWPERVKAVQVKKQEAEIWLSPPEEPYSLEIALKMVAGSKSELWNKAVMEGVGKHRRRGQPKSKRHLAVKALDIKVAYPEATLREVTEVICPCGQREHTNQCRQQLRQQILRLVKFLKQHGHDFTWDRIS